MAMATWREFRPADEPELYDVCLATGDAGADGRGLYRDERLLGDIYVGPYLAFAPRWARVLDAGGRGVGYTLAVTDTAAYDAWLGTSWLPALRARLPRPDGDPAAWDRDEQLAALAHDWTPTDPSIVTDYPAHMHIDLLPEVQGGGHGRAGVEDLLRRLAIAGVPGLHLVAAASNARAIGFYSALGFAVVRSDDEDCVMGVRL